MIGFNVTFVRTFGDGSRAVRYALPETLPTPTYGPGTELMGFLRDEGKVMRVAAVRIHAAGTVELWMEPESPRHQYADLEEDGWVVAPSDGAPLARVDRESASTGDVRYDTARQRFDGVTAEIRQRWMRAYPEIEVARELRRAGDYLTANPDCAGADLLVWLESWMATQAGERRNLG